MMPPRLRSLATADETATEQVATPSYYGRVATLLSIIGLLLNITSISRITEVFPGLEIVRQACLTGIILIAILSIPLAILLRELLAPVIIAFFIVSIPFSAWVFSTATGTSYVPLSGGDYYSGALIGIFYLTWKHGSPQTLLRGIYRISLIYAFVYLILWVGLTANVIALPDKAKILIAADAGSSRDARIVLSNTFATYGLAVAVVGMVYRPSVRDGLCILIFATCFYLAQSRVISALVVIGMISYAVIATTRLEGSRIVQRVAFAIFCIGLISSVYVAFTPGVNPFSDDRYNLSEWARSEEIRIAQNLIPNHALLGIGISNGTEAYAPISDVNFFYPADIGLVGVLVSYGIPGLILYFFIVCGACFATSKLLRAVDAKLVYAFGLTGAILTIYSVLATVFAATAWGSMFLSLLFANVRRPIVHEVPTQPVILP